jgi:hypothetical protein
MLFNGTYVCQENNFPLLPVLRKAVENRFVRKPIFTEMMLIGIMTPVYGQDQNIYTAMWTELIIRTLSNGSSDKSRIGLRSV